ADEVDVRVDAAGDDDLPLAGDDLGARADDQPRVDPALCERVARLADGDDVAVADADVALDDSPVVDDDGVGDHQVAMRRAHRLVQRALVLTVANRLAAAEDRLLAVVGVVVLDLDDQLRVGEADPVALGRAILLRIRLAGDLDAHGWVPGISRRSYQPGR